MNKTTNVREGADLCLDCGGDRVVPMCPFGCPEGTYDNDTHVCSECREAVAADLVCLDCYEK